MSDNTKVSIADVRSKAQELQGAAEATRSTAKEGATWALGGLVLLVLVVFLLGRRRGRSGGAVVEVYKV